MFIRCIKPNTSQCSGIFDESFVRTQLISSGSIAYQQLMRIGFPSHMSIEELFNMFKSNVEFEKYTFPNSKEFCNQLLRSCGLKWKDFKLGNTQVFFRTGKLEILSGKINNDMKIIKRHIEKLKLLRKKLKKAIIVARFCVIGRGHRKKGIELANDERHEEQINNPGKKRKLNKKSSRLAQTLTEHTEMDSEGNEYHTLHA